MEMKDFTPNDWARYVNKWAEEKGWNSELTRSPQSIGTQLMLMTTELAEAFEEIRTRAPLEQFDIYFRDANGTECDDSPTARQLGWKPEGFPVELVDCLIRIFHTAGYYGIDLNDILAVKMAYNEKRPYRHGGKSA